MSVHPSSRDPLRSRSSSDLIKNTFRFGKKKLRRTTKKVDEFSSEAISRRSTTGNISTSKGAVRQCSRETLDLMEPEVVQKIKIKHTRDWSIDRTSRAIPKMSIEQIDTLLKSNKHHTYEELALIGKQLTVEQKRVLFKGLPEMITISVDPYWKNEYTLHRVQLFITMLSSHTEDPKIVGKYLSELIYPVQIKMIHFVKPSEIAYAIHIMKIDPCQFLYRELEPSLRKKVDECLKPYIDMKVHTTFPYEKYTFLFNAWLNSWRPKLKSQASSSTNSQSDLSKHLQSDMIPTHLAHYDWQTY